jgi:hypothetical protein
MLFCSSKDEDPSKEWKRLPPEIIRFNAFWGFLRINGLPTHNRLIFRKRSWRSSRLYHYTIYHPGCRFEK